MIKKQNIKGLLIDLEGVLYIGEKLIEGAVKCINNLKSQDFQIRYLTNTTTTPRELILKKLKRFNLPAVESDIFTPIIAAKNFLKQKNITKIYLLANPSLRNEFKNFVFDENSPEAIILGDIYKEFNWEILNKTFQIIAEKNAIIIALHKNKYCRREEKITLDLGPFVKALEYASSRNAIVMGKPEKKFFDLALQDMNLTKKQVIMIGDDILSDIAGAKKNNITAIQVMTGKYQKKDESNIYVQPDYRITSISSLADLL